MRGPPVPSVFLYAIDEDPVEHHEVRAPRAGAQLGTSRSSGAVALTSALLSAKHSSGSYADSYDALREPRASSASEDAPDSGNNFEAVRAATARFSDERSIAGRPRELRTSSTSEVLSEDGEGGALLAGHPCSASGGKAAPAQLPHGPGASGAGGTGPAKAWWTQCWAVRLVRDCARGFWARGAMCMAVSTLIMTTSALCVKLIDGRVPLFEVVLFRSAFSAAMCGALARAQGVPRMFGPARLWPIYAVRGIPGAASMVFYYQSIAMLPLSDAMTLMYSNPALCAVFAWILGNEPVTFMCLMGVLATVVGVVFIAQPPFLFGQAAWDQTRLLGSVAGMLAALTAAVAFTAIKFVPRGEPTVVLAMWFHCSALAMSIIPLAVGMPEAPMWPCGRDLGLLAGVALTSFFGQYTLNRSFQLLAASHASAVNTLQVLWGHLYGVLLVGEPETLFAVGGSALIASGVVSLSLRPSPKEGAPCPAPARPDALVPNPTLIPHSAPPGELCASAALPEPAAAAASALACVPGALMPEHRVPGAAGAGSAARARGFVGLAQRLRAWATRRGRRARHVQAQAGDAAEAESLVAAGAEGAPGGAKAAPAGAQLLEGQWAGTAEGESPRHVALLVAPGR